MSNDTLVLRGSFERRSAANPGPPTLPKEGYVTAEKLMKLCAEIHSAMQHWENEPLGINPLISVRYIRVAAKSNRIRKLLTEGSGDASDYIVGARFDTSDGRKSPKHVITYCVTVSALQQTIDLIKECSEIVCTNYSGAITDKQLAEATKSGSSWSHPSVKKTVFGQVIRDAYYVEEFFVAAAVENITDNSFVTFYKTGVKTKTLLDRLGLDVKEERILGESVRLYSDEYSRIRKEAPYLIAMALEDLADYGPGDTDKESNQDTQGRQDVASYVFPTIPSPQGEPIVGVIDTVFGEDAYFKEWVDPVDCTDANLPNADDIIHGTEVSSIIVDGPALNPHLQDGCGRFRVKHFGVSRGGIISSFGLMRDIRDIVTANSHIKVWNLSLGTPKECPDYSISPVAAMLDELQHDLDVVFVVAGTNGGAVGEMKRIGAPADSINAIVVNSVDSKRMPAIYSRKGPVLSFFNKPDLAYYGGTPDEPLIASAPFATMHVRGTSFAAPWITRKVAFLIYKAGRTKEEAKALLIDSAYGWGEEPLDLVRGYGVPPINIRDIIETPNNEIRFVISGNIDAYETYNHKIPVPIHDGKYPYMARATLCYFPECQRNQGVDYTSTELDLHFGRLKKGSLDSLDKNFQGDEGKSLYEGDARNTFRKWDNVKHIADIPKSRFVPRIAYDKPIWGLTLRKKERSNQNAQAGNGMAFSVVVTLKEMFNKNRIDDFIYRCSFDCGWIVNHINMDIINEIYEAADVDVIFED